MGTFTISMSHLPAWAQLSTLVLEKESSLLFSANRDPKTKVKDISQGLALAWRKRNRVPYSSTGSFMIA
jgi:hypothetical protein